ncbi:MAG: homoserine kinase [Betaproteobacteria bacterium]|nr:homoserine kinase [Betaproteobacteria bacterium]
MSVYTSVSRSQLSAWLGRYDVGALRSLRGIAAGIENTNYFVTTARGRFVLTLFEKLQPAELPFYLGLMTHLSARGIACPRPVPDDEGRVFSELNGKPATLVSRLPGHDVAAPDSEHCTAVGAMLAHMHLAGTDYAHTMPNPRGLLWWRGAALEVLPRMPAAEAALLEQELEYQSRARLDALPSGAIHADLFRDNVLFDGRAIGGVIDFYFACTDRLLYDLAITVNDWCIDPNGALDPGRTRALLRAYRSVRPLAPAEIDAWPTLLRAGALRFWLSRLYDLHCPRPGELTFAKDPGHFQRVLQARMEAEDRARGMLAE